VDCRNDAIREGGFLEVNADWVLDISEHIEAWLEIKRELLVGHEVSKVEP